MSNTRVTYQQLIAFAAGDLSAARSAEVEAHLARDASAAETVARYRTARSTMQGDDGADPPTEAMARAKGIYEPTRFAQPRPGLIEAAMGAVAQLVFDSRAETAMGLRGQATSFQLTYELSSEPPAELDLHAEIDDDAGEGWRLVGQVATREPLGSLRVELCRAGGDGPVNTVEGDDRGTFILHAGSGVYDLRLHTPQGVTVVQDLRLE